MTNQALEFRRQAEQAREFARSAPMSEDRQFWLELAAQWDVLAERATKQDGLIQHPDELKDRPSSDGTERGP
jgi:hypothetical protein